MSKLDKWLSFTNDNNDNTLELIGDDKTKEFTLSIGNDKEELKVSFTVEEMKEVLNSFYAFINESITEDV